MFNSEKKTKSKKWLQILAFVLTIVIVIIIAVAVYIRQLLTPVSQNSQETIRFVVPKGQAITTIGQRLESEGIIHNRYAFRFIVQMNDLASKIQAGSFDLSPTSSTQEIAFQLTQGTQDVWVTLLEGWRREEIAESLANQDLDNFDKAEFLEISSQSEGMLFPDSYLIPREMSTENIYSLLTNTFERKVTQELSKEIENSQYSFEDVLIMASLVEREARNYDQMRMVAGILWNRIEIGMPLQVDATLQYVTGYNEFQQTWWAPPTAAQKQIKSNFNTYQNLGLPPAPIANPSLNAIKATLNPLESANLFYIHANDGNMYVAETLEQHNANINRYLR